MIPPFVFRTVCYSFPCAALSVKNLQLIREWQCCGPHYVDADPYPDCHFDAVADPNPSFQVKAQNLEKVLN